MRIYIIGSVASGKSTLARKISQQTGVPCHHLDEVAHTIDETAFWGNKKRSEEERDTIFNDIISKNEFIIEDAGRSCFENGLLKADTIILLEIPMFIRRKRIFTRFIKQKFGIEKSSYRPRLKILASMLKWVKNYDSGEDGTKRRISKYQDKIIVLQNSKEIKQYLLKLE